MPLMHPISRANPSCSHLFTTDVDEAVMRIENQLMEHEIFTENVLAGGGDDVEFGACQLFPVSGLTGEGLDDFVEGLALQSELMDLRADHDARGEGIVIDARMEKGLGVVADCVIRWGKVEPGDFVVSGTHGGKVRFLNDGEWPTTTNLTANLAFDLNSTLYFYPRLICSWKQTAQTSQAVSTCPYSRVQIAT
jgi:translation initiation factor IF-2